MNANSFNDQDIEDGAIARGEEQRDSLSQTHGTPLEQKRNIEKEKHLNDKEENNPDEEISKQTSCC